MRWKREVRELDAGAGGMLEVEMGGEWALEGGGGGGRAIRGS